MKKITLVLISIFLISSLLLVNTLALGDDIGMDFGWDTDNVIIAVVEANENNVKGGYITEDEGVYTAVCYEKSTFDGWYSKEGNLISKEASISIKDYNGYCGARFITKNLINDSGFENYTMGAKIYDYQNTEKQNWIMHGGTKIAPLTAWGTIYADGAYKFSGDKSMKMNPPWQTVTTDVTLKPNTNYLVSLNYAYTTQNAGTYITGLEYGFYSPDANNTNYSALPHSAINTAVPGKSALQSTWYNTEFLYTTGDTIPKDTVFGYIYRVANDDVSVSATEENKTDLYLDDIVVMPVEVFGVNIDAKNNATIHPVNNSKIDYAIEGVPYSFEVITEPGLTPTVYINNEGITADENGIYTVVPTKNLSIKIDCNDNEVRPMNGKDYEGNDLTKYNRDLYLKSFDEGETVYHESVMFYEGRDTAKLLYPISEVVSVRSYDLKTTFIKGVDFEITADGQLKLLENSRIKAYPTTLTKDFANATTDEQYYYIENNLKTIELLSDVNHAKYSLAVTYKHTEKWGENEGYQGIDFSGKAYLLPKTIEKLENGETVNIVVFGASTSCGWSSSGLNNQNYDNNGTLENNVLDMAPYAETWMDMVLGELKEKYPKATINMKNIALEGKTSKWGMEELANRLAWLGDFKTDLLVTSFGANDLSGGYITAENYKTYMQAIVDIIRNPNTANGNENAEVLLWSYPLSNGKVERYAEGRFTEFEEKLVELEAENTGVATIKITSASKEITKSKLPADYLSNNCNHVDDFGVRVMAQGILSAFEKPEFIPGDINGDAKVDLKDVTDLAKYLAGWNNEVVTNALDINGDKLCNLKDLTLLAQKVAGWKVELSANTNNSSNNKQIVMRLYAYFNTV